MTLPVYQNASTALYHGDCRDVMAALEADSIDAILTDPPYGLTFMGKDWDRHVPGEAFWREALRVAKPGAHMLAFGGTRTFHRLTCAIEDAGWEIRDCLMWVYGSGFPKSLDVSKAIDKEAGVEREVVGVHPLPGYAKANVTQGQQQRFTESFQRTSDEPASADAAAWQGWGTALKPAWEPIILARKPLAKGHTVAANVLRYGTGGVNVDGCRIQGEKGVPASVSSRSVIGWGTGGDMERKSQQNGRFPSNVLHDGSAEVRTHFPSESRSAYPGNQAKADARVGHETVNRGVTTMPGNTTGLSYSDEGSAARFFYTAKANARDRGHGNTHPTVKPTDLLQYLARLITPPGGTILDPFMGSGSTGVATIYEGFRFVGIDLDRKWVDVAWQRMAQQSLFSGVSPNG